MATNSGDAQSPRNIVVTRSRSRSQQDLKLLPALEYNRDRPLTTNNMDNLNASWSSASDSETTLERDRNGMVTRNRRQNIHNNPSLMPPLRFERSRSLTPQGRNSRLRYCPEALPARARPEALSARSRPEALSTTSKGQEFPSEYQRTAISCSQNEAAFQRSNEIEGCEEAASSSLKIYKPQEFREPVTPTFVSSQMSDDFVFDQSPSTSSQASPASNPSIQSEVYMERKTQSLLIPNTYREKGLMASLAGKCVPRSHSLPPVLFPTPPKQKISNVVSPRSRFLPKSPTGDLLDPSCSFCPSTQVSPAKMTTNCAPSVSKLTPISCHKKGQTNPHKQLKVKPVTEPVNATRKLFENNVVERVKSPIKEPSRNTVVSNITESTHSVTELSASFDHLDNKSASQNDIIRMSPHLDNLTNTSHAMPKNNCRPNVANTSQLAAQCIVPTNTLEQDVNVGTHEFDNKDAVENMQVDNNMDPVQSTNFLECLQVDNDKTTLDSKDALENMEVEEKTSLEMLKVESSEIENKIQQDMQKENNNSLHASQIEGKRSLEFSQENAFEVSKEKNQCTLESVPENKDGEKCVQEESNKSLSEVSKEKNQCTLQGVPENKDDEECIKEENKSAPESVQEENVSGFYNTYKNDASELVGEENNSLNVIQKEKKNLLRERLEIDCDRLVNEGNGNKRSKLENDKPAMELLQEHDNGMFEHTLETENNTLYYTETKDKITMQEKSLVGITQDQIKSGFECTKETGSSTKDEAYGLECTQEQVKLHTQDAEAANPVSLDRVFEEDPGYLEALAATLGPNPENVGLWSDISSQQMLSDYKLDDCEFNNSTPSLLEILECNGRVEGSVLVPGCPPPSKVFSTYDVASNSHD